jgi:hypothetical protein
MTQPRGPPSGLDGAWCHRSWPGRGQPYRRDCVGRTFAGLPEDSGPHAPQVGMRGPPYAANERESGACHASHTVGAPRVRPGSAIGGGRGEPGQSKPPPPESMPAFPLPAPSPGRGLRWLGRYGRPRGPSTGSARAVARGCGRGWGQGGDEPLPAVDGRGTGLWITLGKFRRQGSDLGRRRPRPVENVNYAAGSRGCPQIPGRVDAGRRRALASLA